MQINQTNQVLFRDRFVYYVHRLFFFCLAFKYLVTPGLTCIQQHTQIKVRKSPVKSRSIAPARGFSAFLVPARAAAVRSNSLCLPLLHSFSTLTDCTSMILSTCHEMWSHPNGNLHAHVQNRKLFWLNEMQQLQQLSEQEQRSPEAKLWQAAKNVFMSLSWYEITSVGGGGEICRHRW